MQSVKPKIKGIFLEHSEQTIFYVAYKIKNSLEMSHVT